jgi:hypothetical protein
MYWKVVGACLVSIASGVYFGAMINPQPIVPDPAALSISITGAKDAVLLADYVRIVNGYKITVLKGLKFDGMSVPDKLDDALGLSRFSPSVIAAALLHDALYASEWVPQAVADSILYACALEDGTEKHKAKAIWQAVHDCGEVVWSRHTLESIEKARQLVKVEKI